MDIFCGFLVCGVSLIDETTWNGHVYAEDFLSWCTWTVKAFAWFLLAVRYLRPWILYLERI